MKPGYYWWRRFNSMIKEWSGWKPCEISGGYAHFFGEISQELGNEYLTRFVEFGPEIVPPPSV